MGVNRVILLGNAGRDPEMNYADPENPVANVTLATNERTPGGQNITEWHRVVMTGQKALIAERYIRKGTKLYLEGRLRTRVYVDRYQIKHYITEIYADNFELLGRTDGGNAQQ